MADSPLPLTVSAEPDHLRVPPGLATVWVVVTLQAGPMPVESRRPRLVSVLSLDVSGSMRGEPLEHVVRSAQRIVDLLADDDMLGLVTFSTRASVVAPVVKLDAEARRTLKHRIGRLVPEDRTNIEDALRVARAALPPAQEGERHGIVLLSDGEPNVGASTAEELEAIARAIRGNAVVASLGYGTRHDEKVLAGVATGGGGAYRFIPDPMTCQLELTQAVGAQADVAVEGVEAVVTPETGVEVLRVLGAPAPRYGAEGLVVPLPDLTADARRSFALEVRVTLDERNASGRLLALVVRHRRAGERAPLEVGETVSVDVGKGEARRSEAATATLLLLRADEARDRARGLADRGQFDGAAAVLRGLMAEIVAAPGFVQADGSALAEAYEQLLDEAGAFERRPGAEQYRTFKMSMVARSVAVDGGVASSKSMGALSKHFTMVTAGLFPEAYLVVDIGPQPGTRHRLGAQNTLGRTRSADVFVPSGQISRRHADVFALEGEFWIADLGSTNVTHVNGVSLGTKPHVLRNGDKVSIGDVLLTYVEAPRT
jgi:Ca-activated chloride channel family protein